MRLNSKLLSAVAMIALSCTALTPIAGWAKTTVKPPVAAPAAPAVPPLVSVDFAHKHSDLPADPNVRFGQLPNGMTYAILKNATPAGTASVRFRIAAGSLMEAEDQRGLAHFIEHMIFRGSKNVGANEFVKILERHGLKFGPDTNAHTGFNETAYELDLPKNDPELVDTALFLMREVAGNVTFDPKMIEEERGVVLGEERARASPGLRNYIAWSQAAFKGQKYPDRLPIGTVEVLKNAQRDRFVDFYNAFYRPELSTLIVVGDFNPDEIEAKIKAKFSDWKPATPGANRAVDFGSYTNKDARAFTYVEPGLPDSISLTWGKPFDGSYQTAAKVREDMIRSLAIGILNQRLERQAKEANTAFAAAGFDHEAAPRTAEMGSLNITPKPGKAKEAYAQAYRTLAQFIAFGAQPGELERQLSNLDASIEAAAKGEKTRSTPGLASEMVSNIDDNVVISSPSQDLAFYKKLRPELTLAAINAAASQLTVGDGPLISHSGSDLGGLDEAALMAGYAALKQEKPVALAAIAQKPWPYTNFGAPAKAAKSEAVADLGLKQITYANGVKLTLKPTKFEDDRIAVNVRFAGGRRAYLPGGTPPLTMANFLGVFEGGLGKLTAEEIKDTLAGKLVSVNFGIGDDAITLSGSTTRADFATQMQVLAAFTTDAALRPEALDRLKAFLPDYYKRLATSPEGVFSMKGSGILHAGDTRFTFPDEATLNATTIESVRSVSLNALKNAPVEITIVGDFDEAQALELVGQTFAALPARPKAPALDPKAATTAFPTTNLHQVLTHKGRADQNLSFVAWPIPDFYSDMKRARGLEMLAEVIGLRLIDEVRVKQGATYSPSAYSSPSSAFTGYGFIAASAGVKPEMDQSFYDTLSGIAEALKTQPVTADELTRARKPAIDKLEANRKTNGYWAGALPGSITDPRRLTSIRTRIDQLNAITPADLQVLAKTYLDMSKALRLQVKPDASVAPATTAAK